jgi:HEAT repeat protein
MRTTFFAILGLATASSLAACVDPQVHPAPEHVQTPTRQVQASDPAPAQAGPAGPAGPTGPSTASPQAPQASAADVKQKVMVLLGGIEHIPSREEFLRAGTDDQVVAVLGEVARDGAAKLRHRANAAAAMSHYPRPDTRKALEALINEEPLDEVLRRPSIKAYAFAFGADAIPLVSKMLEHKDRNTREAALRSLADIKTPAARQAIETRLKVETDDALKKLGQETLARWK